MKKLLITTMMAAGLAMSGSAMAADAAAGQAKAASCAGCHGANGKAAVPTYPSLAGQNAAYLEKSMKDYLNGNRSDGTMKAMLSGFSDADIANVAAYYAGM